MVLLAEPVVDGLLVTLGELTALEEPELAPEVALDFEDKVRGAVPDRELAPEMPDVPLTSNFRMLAETTELMELIWPASRLAVKVSGSPSVSTVGKEKDAELADDELLDEELPDELKDPEELVLDDADELVFDDADELV